MSIQYDVIIVGAGAAGMMSAIEAGKRGRKFYSLIITKKLVKRLEFLVEEDVILLILTLILINFFHKTLSS
jgi:thioredoxin reductase